MDQASWIKIRRVRVFYIQFALSRWSRFNFFGAWVKESFRWINRNAMVVNIYCMWRGYFRRGVWAVEWSRPHLSDNESDSIDKNGKCVYEYIGRMKWAWKSFVVQILPSRITKTNTDEVCLAFSQNITNKSNQPLNTVERKLWMTQPHSLFRATAWATQHKNISRIVPSNSNDQIESPSFEVIRLPKNKQVVIGALYTYNFAGMWHNPFCSFTKAHTHNIKQTSLSCFPESFISLCQWNESEWEKSDFMM